jgi:UDP-N-acetyl-D-mannosaminuronic acid transferase (WecB/TagA/CpsF family)
MHFSITTDCGYKKEKEKNESLLKTIQMSNTSLLNVGISRSQLHYNSTQRGK